MLLLCRYLGVSSLSALHGDTCNEVPGLVWRQVEVCRNNPQSLFCISEGARRGILECKQQFRYERWNCTTQPNHSVFGQILSKGSAWNNLFYFTSLYSLFWKKMQKYVSPNQNFIKFNITFSNQLPYILLKYWQSSALQFIYINCLKWCIIIFLCVYFFENVIQTKVNI